MLATPTADSGTAGPSTVLCVDDEPNILTALKRVLRKADHGVLLAGGGVQALQVLEQTPVDLVISDMRMPGMDGAEFLEKVHVRWPHVVRVLLTGNADTPSAMAAINRGGIFRYLQKPWNEAELLDAVHEGLSRLALQRDKARLEALAQEQNIRLSALNAELEARVQSRTVALHEANEKLKQNYLKSIKVFSNLLELRGGPVAGHGRRVAELARDMARKMKLPEDEVLKIFVAGLLHDVGLIGLGDKLLAKPVARYLTEEQTLYREHPVQAEQSLFALDDIQPMLPIIRGHHERFDGDGFPDRLLGRAIPLGARIMAVADVFDELQNGHLTAQPATRQEARTLLRHARGTQFDPEIVDIFLQITEPDKVKPPSSLVLTTDALEGDMLLARDLVSANGVLMLTTGHRLTVSLIARIRQFEQREGKKLVVQIQAREAP
jgi:response regulator RpfG family c-di-GMP phosphodiesterase